MKNALKLTCILISIPSMLGMLVSTAYAQVTFVDFQTISGFRSSPPYGWRYSYDIGYSNEAIQIDIDVRLTGLSTTLDQRNIWENGFQNIWSVDAERFGVAMNFNLDWVSSNADLVVDVVQSGNGNLLEWPIERQPAGAFAAHELGHQMGLFDEYSGGAVDPDHPERLNTGGLMHTLSGGTLDYYYDDFLDWYDLNVVPEPSFSALLVGLSALALVSIYRRKK